MRIIEDLKKDEVYVRLLAKFNDEGSFTFGKNYQTTIYCYKEGETIPMDYRALGKYIDAIHYNKLSLYDVPKSLRTEEFFANTFYYTYDYIKNNIEKFDRNFFKDLIMTDSRSLIFDKNCFEIMPIEYIDEEMVSLAILSGTDWSSYRWLLTVNKRKPQVLSEDVWKLAARLYGGRNFSDILTITPKEYQDKEWYQELFKCRYNCGCRCDGRDTYLSNDDRTVLMDYVPKEVLTPEFLIELLKDNPKNIAKFSEYALETEINIGTDKDGNLIKKKIWQLVIENDGYLIDSIDLNEERVAYFKSLYDKDSSEYFCFKYHYRDWKRSQQPKKQNSNTNLGLVFMDAMIYAMEGDDPSKAIDNEVKRNRDSMKQSTDLLPIFYNGSVPNEYKKEYDSEEYLRMMYEKSGIKVLEEYDYLLYRVELPEGFTIKYDGYFGVVKDNNGTEIISFHRDDKFYDRTAEVTMINESIINNGLQQLDTPKRLLKK